VSREWGANSCGYNNGILASITSEELNREIFSRAPLDTGNLWIGLNDLITEGTFVWADETEVVYTNWYEDHPLGNLYDCVAMDSSSQKWVNEECNKGFQMGAVCEVSITPIMDCCLDDPDKTDPGECGCGVADTDSDGDGVADCNDLCLDDSNKTDPGECGCGMADTDSDGDGVADCNDLCPTDDSISDCPCGYFERPLDSTTPPSCYHVGGQKNAGERLNFYDALQECSKDGGSLAKITSIDEATWILSNVWDGDPNEKLWIGVIYQYNCDPYCTGDGNYVYTYDGTGVESNSMWNLDQTGGPTNPNKGCVALNAESKWEENVEAIDHQCFAPRAYLCEYDPAISGNPEGNKSRSSLLKK
jgi:hypothetical protein